PSPSSRHVMEIIIERLGLADSIESLPNLATPPDGLLVSIGGPFNNPYTRAILGTGSGSPLLRLVKGYSGILPVLFDIETQTEPARNEEPSWRVLVNGSEYSSDDCLVFTNIPNPYSDTGGPEDGICVIAARHRAGMMGADRVFSDTRRLERIYKRIRHYHS